MMPYWMRIALGALLGIAAALALWLLVGTPWLTASVGALLAAVGFLGSYFVWSADRLDEGYEQVLFDRPNTIVAALLVVAFAAAGLGTGLLVSEPAPLTTEQRVRALYVDYHALARSHAEGTEPAETNASLDALRIESDRLAIEIEALADADERAALTAANDALALAMDSLKACAGGDRSQCVDARVFAAEAQSALARLAPPAEEPPAEDAPDAAAA